MVVMPGHIQGMSEEAREMVLNHFKKVEDHDCLGIGDGCRVGRLRHEIEVRMPDAILRRLAKIECNQYNECAEYDVLASSQPNALWSLGWYTLS